MRGGRRTASRPARQRPSPLLRPAFASHPVVTSPGGSPGLLPLAGAACGPMPSGARRRGRRLGDILGHADPAGKAWQTWAASGIRPPCGQLFRTEPAPSRSGSGRQRARMVGRLVRHGLLHRLTAETRGYCSGERAGTAGRILERSLVLCQGNAALRPRPGFGGGESRFPVRLRQVSLAH